MKIIKNIIFLVHNFYLNFGLLPSIIFVLFISSILIFFAFEVIKVLLPFTYVAF